MQPEQQRPPFRVGQGRQAGDPASQQPTQLQEPYQTPVPPAPDSDEPEIVDEKQARIAYLRSMQQPKKSHKGMKRVLLVVLALLVVSGGGAGGYLYLQNNKDATPPASTTPHKTVPVVAETETPVSATETYTATGFSLIIKYPKKWVPAEADGKLTITSPATRLTDGTGKAFTGQIVINISPKGEGLTAFDAGNATAVLDSEKLTYTQPTEVQRAQTYLSFAQYANTASTGAIDALFVTGDFGYLKGQALPKVDVQNMDPLLSVTFLKCTDNTCNTAQATAVQAASWSKPAFATPIRSTLESLAIS